MSSNSIFIKKIEKLIPINEEIKINIKFLYIFNDLRKSINVILVTNGYKVYCFGSNCYGVLGFGHENNVEEFTINEELSNKPIIHFKSSNWHTIARDSGGKLYCWGINRCLGNGREDNKISKPEVNKYLINENIIEMCCGWSHTLVLTSNNEVYGWGYNGYGQIGDRSNSNVVLIPFKLDEFYGEKVKAISCGYYHSMAITESGCVYSWGHNVWGQLGLNSKNESENKPQLIEIKVKIEKINCGQFHSILLSHNGDIYVFGSNELKQLGFKTYREIQLTPIKLNHSEKFIEIASHYDYNISAALSENGLYYVWGGYGYRKISSKETRFKSFNEIFAHYFGITYKTESPTVYNSKFNEIEMIAFGNFGIVCKAIDKQNNRIYAIKKVPINNHFKEKALKEINILSKLESEPIVKFESFWIESNYHLESKDLIKNLSSSHELFKPNNTLLLHIQMELCYKTLKEIIEIVNKELNQKGSEVMTPLGYYISSELFIEILESVDYLHNQNIIHRDLKSSNILITSGMNGRFVKIADLGLATINDFDGQYHTKYCGTRKYMAPEVFTTKKYDKKSDIYSIGIICSTLFNIDINESIGDKSCLETEYKNLFDLTEKMSSSRTNKRPDCEEILRKKSLWALSLTQLMKMKTNVKIKTIEESFHMFFIQTKLNSLNFEYFFKFNEIEMIAFGNFGIVCKAIDKQNNRIYAIKKVPINNHFKEKALKEINILSKLESEPIVKFESFWIESNYYLESKDLIKNLSSSHELFKPNNTLLLHIQMELCYKTLKEIIEIVNKELNQKGSEVMTPLGYYISSELFIEILESVDYLHNQNIIHRDLKPSNILITSGMNGRFVKIADFGLATIHDFDGQYHTKYCGTRKYMAPEVLTTEKYDMKADIYSLGIMVPKLFNIDINESIGEKSCLEIEYKNLFDLTEKMSSSRTNKRPDCEEILRKKSLWALSLTKLMKTNLKMNDRIKSIEESFHMFFIQTKLNFWIEEPRAGLLSSLKSVIFCKKNKGGLIKLDIKSNKT